jgi:(1->4)-alpha-D-glucan 1-alpha-D-glucosylmutase
VVIEAERPLESGLDFDQVARAVLRRRRVPTATYRLQFGPSLTFGDAQRLVPYLDALGITDVYASPLLKPCKGSTHGYDICDHNALNPALGAPRDFDEFAAALRSRGMGLIFDLVPNHMGISDPANAWWMDVLENGPSSPYARFFDVDWHPLKADASVENRVLLPVLGDAYGKVLEAGDLKLFYENGAFFLSYYDRRMPIAPKQYGELLAFRLADVIADLGSDDPGVLELQSIITAINYLPAETETDPEKVAERQREKEIVKRRLAHLVGESPRIRAALDETVAEYNGRPGDRQSFDRLHALLDNQSYRLAYWRVAAEEINYRRFFDINDLAAIRIERPEVFAETNRLVLRLVRDRKVTGFRIDHADGLWDPLGYLRQLQRACFLELAQPWLDENAGEDPVARADLEERLHNEYDARIAADPLDPVGLPFYVVVEKILENGESLHQVWPVDGTTGYDFANAVNGLFVDSSHRKAFTHLYDRFRQGRPLPYADLVNSTKKIIMLVSLASEINELGFELKRIAWKNRWYRDFTVNSLTYAVREIIAAFPVYRTYLTRDAAGVPDADRVAVETAVAEAKRRNPRTAAEVFDFVKLVLLRRLPDGSDHVERDEWTNFTMRFQQLTSPVVAKGVEDTAFYVYNRLLSLNEVGGDPEQFGISPAAFHRLNQERLRHWPHAMLAQSTHDSKRSADVRARIDVLSELPRSWRTAIGRWSRFNRPKKTIVAGEPAPDRNDEYFIYQTLLGAWPLEPMDPAQFDEFRQRIKSYVQKAIREAKVHSSWVNPNTSYDDAVARFLDLVLTERPKDRFLTEFAKLRDVVAFFGMLNALSARLLETTSPGVPDLYQGDELWNFRLVDPDNRAPVDYQQRSRLLDELRREAPSPTLVSELLETWTDGRIKLYLTARALDLRRSRSKLFSEGSYQSLEPSGTHAERVVGLARTLGGEQVLTIVPRLVAGLTREATVLPLGEEIWQDTVVEIPGAAAGDCYRDPLSDSVVVVGAEANVPVIRAADAFRVAPFALLVRE